jgi:hypothetical protein
MVMLSRRSRMGLSRWRRVHSESGILGLAIRLLSRLVRSTGTRLTALADRMICDIPYRWLTPFWLRKELEVWRSIEKRHSDQRLFILGTGPSLAAVDLSTLHGELIIIVNQGFLHARESGLTPSYLAIIDEAYLEPKFQTTLVDLARFCATSGTQVLCTRAIAERLRRQPISPVCVGAHLIMRSRYFEATGRELPLDFTQALPGFESVIHFAIAAALLMGVRKIVLLGCDMNYFLQPNEVYGHSYKNDAIAGVDLPATELFDMDQVELLELGHAEYRSFRTLRIMAERRGVHIVNGTAGGNLEVFDRRALEQILRTR